jgi:hypothetical protein
VAFTGTMALRLMRWLRLGDRFGQVALAGRRLLWTCRPPSAGNLADLVGQAERLKRADRCNPPPVDVQRNRLQPRSNSRHRSRFAARHVAVLVLSQSRDGPER